MINIIEAMADTEYFGDVFKKIETWSAWQTFLKALFGLRMEKAELEFFKKCTGLDKSPRGRISEVWALIGRSGGKSSMAALLAVWQALLHDWTPYLRPGERPHVFVIAVTRYQARVIKEYIIGILESKPIMKKMIAVNRQFEIDLTNGVTIACQPCSYRAIRGKTVVCAILEEVCFWRWEEESAVQDKEVLRALRPSMGRVPESLLIAISTPYINQGIMAESFNDYWGKPGSALCWKATTRMMNPTYPQAEIDREYEKDPESAASEYGAEWRSDTSGAYPPEAVDAAHVPRRYELPHKKDTEYIGAIDPSGGKQDSFTMSIVHLEDGKIVQDAARETRPRFRPENVVAEYAKLFKDYGVSRIQSDRYAGEWVSSAFADHGIEVESARMTKSEFYLEMLPLMINGSAELLDNTRQRNQFKSLQRRPRAGGKDMIDNFLTGGHDDCSNVCAIACVTAAQMGKVVIGKIHLPGKARKKKAKAVKEEPKPPRDFAEMIAPDASKIPKGFMLGEKRKEAARPERKKKYGQGVIYTGG